MLMIVYWFDIVLIIESVLQGMVILVLHFMTALMLMLIIVAFVIVTIAMSMLIRCHVMI